MLSGTMIPSTQLPSRSTNASARVLLGHEPPLLMSLQICLLCQMRRC